MLGKTDFSPPMGCTFREGFGDGFGTRRECFGDGRGTSLGRECFSGRKPPLHGVIVFHFLGEFVLIYDCVLQKKVIKQVKIVIFLCFSRKIVIFLLRLFNFLLLLRS